MRLPNNLFKTIIALAVMSLFVMTAFMLPATGDVLQSMGTGAGAASSKFGWNITYAGNVNNDAFDDVLIGAPGENKAYLFLGPVANLNPAGASATFTGVASSNFGWSVRTAFDVNTDGFDDVIIGAPGEDKAYIFFGSASISGTITSASADVALNGEAGSDFGFSVCGVGDFTSDGNNDVFVGAPKETTVSTYTNGGSVFLFNDVGSRSSWIVGDPNFGPALNLTGKANNEYFGWSISYAGNFDGDGSGLGDLIIGAPGTNSNCGAAYVEAGKPVHPAYPKGAGNVVDAALMDNKFFGNQSGSMAGNKFGFCVSNASNFGGSANDDVIVGAPNRGTGYAYVIFGSGSPQNYEVGVAGGADFVILGDVPGNDLGKSVTWLGDFNGDGNDDIAVSAQWNNSKSGCVYVFYGPRIGSATAGTGELHEYGAAPSDGFGFSISGGGICTPASTPALLTTAKGSGGAGKAYVYVVNKLPTVSALTHTPSTGNGATSFTFSATYTDGENDAPAAGFPKLRLYSDSGGTSELSISPIVMTSTDSTYTDGSIFSASTTLPHGTTYYRVQIKADSGDSRQAWSAGTKLGPTADLIAPGTVTDLRAEALASPTEDDEGSVKLRWTFPGDDNFDTATVKNLTLRYRNATEGNFTEANFNESKIVVEWYIDPVPKSGNWDFQYTIDPIFGLDPGENYYFAVRGTDEEENWGGLSNLIDTDAYLTPNVDPPDPINNIVAEDVPDDTGGAVNLTWELSTAPDLAFYRIYGGTTFFDDVTTINPIIDDLVTGDGWQVITGLGSKPLENGEYYYFAVTAVDVVGLENPSVNGSWVRVLDNTAPKPPGITGVTLEDTPGDNGGSLTVTWDESTDPDFDCYKVYINDKSYTNLIGKTNETAIFDKATTSVKITTMDGYAIKEGRKYWVTVTQQSINEKENKTVSADNTDGPQYAMDNSATEGPGTITGLTATDLPGDDGGALSLVWAGFRGVGFGFYYVYIDDVPITSVETKSPEKILSTNVDKTTVNSIGGDDLVDGQEYYVAVTVVSYHGVETKSISLGENSVGPVKSINNSDTIKPPAVGGWAKKDSDDTTITFEWDALELLDFQKYVITFYPSDEEWKMETLDIEDITTTEMTITGLDSTVTYVFNISAVDNTGNRGPYSKDIFAKVGKENEPPVINGISWSPQKPTTDTESISFTVDADDDGGVDDLTVWWDFDNDGTDDKLGWTQSWTKYTQEDTYTLKVTVDDGEGGVTSKTFNMTIGPPEKTNGGGNGNTLIFATIGIFAVLLVVAIVVVVIIVFVIKKKKPEGDQPEALEPEALPSDQPQPMGAPPPGQPQPMGDQPQPMGPPPGQQQPQQPTAAPAQEQPQPVGGGAAPPAQEQPPQQAAAPVQQDMYAAQQPDAGAAGQPDYGAQAQPDMAAQPPVQEQPDMGQQPAADPMAQPPAQGDPFAQPQVGDPAAPQQQPPAEEDPFAL